MNRNLDLLNSIKNIKIQNSQEDSLDEWNNKLNNDLLTIIHVNIRSLRKNWDWLMIKLENILPKLDVLVLSEININNEEAECYHIKNFNRISICRTYMRGGGVMLFHRDTYHADTLTYSFDDSENINVQIKHQATKTEFKILAIYRPPKANQQKFTEDIKWWLTNAVKKDENIIMIGDLNICTLKRNSANFNYLNMLSNCLLLPTINTPTREEMKAGKITQSCVDHLNIKLNNSLQIFSSVIKEKPADHWFIACRITMKNKTIPKDKKETIYIETVDKKRVQKEIEKTNWKILDNIEDPVRLYTELVSKFKEIYSNSIKIYEKTTKDFSSPWVNNKVKNEIRLKSALLKQWRNNKNNILLYETYKKQRNIVTNTIKKEKRKYLFRLFNQANGNVKKMWSLINEIMNRKIRQPNDEILKKNFQTNDLMNLSNLFNKDFLHKIKELREQNRGTLFNVREIEYNKHGEQSSMFIRKAKEKDIDKIITNLNKTGPGMDGIRLQDLTQNRMIFTPILTKLINLMLNTATIPDKLKISCVSPLYKKGEKNSLSNYRPIGSMPVVEKILEKYINTKTNQYLSENSILPEFQHGFQEKKSTYTLLRDFSEIINNALDHQKYVVIIYVDLSSAFCAIDHEILLRKLKDIGINHPLFSNYFQNRKQITKIGKITSSEELVEHGLIQGGINSPTWYNIYTYDIKYLQIRGHIKMFADDSCLLSIHKDPNIAVENAQADLMNLQKYFYNNSIFLNNKKTEIMILGPKRRTQININKVYCHTRKCLERDSAITCDCQPIEYTDQAKYLGILVDNKFKMKGHVLHLCKKLRVLNYNFHKMDANCLPMITKKTLYFSLVESLIRYGVTMYTFAPNYCLDPLNNIQRKIQKYLFDNKPDLKLMTPKQLANYIALCDHFQNEKYRRTKDVTYEFRRKQKFIKYLPYTKYGERLLEYKIPTLLDEYCTEILDETNINIMKKKLKIKLLEN